MQYLICWQGLYLLLCHRYLTVIAPLHLKPNFKVMKQAAKFHFTVQASEMDLGYFHGNPGRGVFFFFFSSCSSIQWCELSDGEGDSRSDELCLPKIIPSDVCCTDNHLPVCSGVILGQEVLCTVLCPRSGTSRFHSSVPDCFMW